MTNANRKILVTCALPYANGPIHLGHMLEYTQADIWVRFHKLCGQDCLFLCGDDAHGTPIMLSAKKQGITPEALIANIHTLHCADMNDFYIDFDHFYTTHSDENRELSEQIFLKLQENGEIETRDIEQAYDPIEKMFLPDRFIKGECPRCNAQDQYGDNCEVCGSTYSATEIINPVSAVSGATPITKTSLHYFFKLDQHQTMLQAWADNNHLQAPVANKLKEWFEQGLQQWDISRDAPYFGFNIPGTTDKYFYVWVDAPVGYMATLKNLIKQRPELKFGDYWDKNSTADIYHFVGKDIIYFHALFWPAILAASGYRTPTAIYTHGFLTVNGQKMSKSRGTFVLAHDYLSVLNPEYLRYYFAAKLGDGVDDIDLNIEDFVQRVNADLIGKLVNIASRTAGFIRKKFDNTLSAELIEPALYEDFIEHAATIKKHYENRQFSTAVREIMALADKANRFIDDKKPWGLIKEPGNEKIVHDVCTLALNLFKLLMIFLKPILPKMAADVEAFLNIEPLVWADINTPLLNHQINKFKPLMTRVDAEVVAGLFGKANRGAASRPEARD